MLFYNAPLQDCYQKFVQSGFLDVHEGPAMAEDIEKYDNCLLIFDDQPLSTKEYHLEEIFNYKTHHNFCGAIAMIHNPYDKKFRSLRRASNVVVLTNNVRNLSHAQSLSREAFCYQANILYKILHKLTSLPNYDQLIVNLQNSTPNKLMVQSGPFPPNTRKTYEYDGENRQGFRTGTLLKNNQPINTLIDNKIYNTGQSPILSNTPAPVSSNDISKEPPETIKHQRQKSETDTSKNSSESNQQPEVHPGVPYSPDLLRSQQTKTPERGPEVPTTKQTDKNIVQNPPESMSIDYSNLSSTKSTIKPGSEWLHDLSEPESVSKNAGTKGSVSDQYLSLTPASSDALATIDTNSMAQDIDSSLRTSKSSAALDNNSKEDFTQILSKKIINTPLDTTEHSDDVNSKLSIPQQDATSKDSVLSDILNAPEEGTDIMNRSTLPNPLAEQVDPLNQKSIYDPGYTRDDSFLPNWRARQDVSLSIPKFRGLFQPRVFSSPVAGNQSFIDCLFHILNFIYF